MLIKKSQAILKCFIDPQELSIWFTLGLEDETMLNFVTLRTFFSSTAGQGVENTK